MTSATSLINEKVVLIYENRQFIKYELILSNRHVNKLVLNVLRRKLAK
jgi:hypothetical protein